MRVGFGATKQHLINRIFIHPVSPSAAGENSQVIQHFISWLLLRRCLQNKMCCVSVGSSVSNSSHQTSLQLLRRRQEVPTLPGATPDVQNTSHRSHYGGRVHERGSDQPCDGERAHLTCACGEWQAVMTAYDHLGAAEHLLQSATIVTYLFRGFFYLLIFTSQ